MPKKKVKTTSYLSTREVLQQINEITPISRVTLWHWINKGAFPKPTKLGPGKNGRVGWPPDVVARWVKKRTTLDFRRSDPKVKL